MTTHAVLARRVNRGAALLDTIKPGWQNEVRILDLNMSSGCACILGQIFEPETEVNEEGDDESGFDAGLRLYSGHRPATQAATKWSISNGFGIDYDNDGGWEDYPSLRDLWVTEIEARLA